MSAAKKKTYRAPAMKTQVAAVGLLVEVVLDAIAEHPNPLGCPEAELLGVVKRILPWFDDTKFEQLKGMLTENGLATFVDGHLRRVR